VVLDEPGRLLCDECLPEQKADVLAVASERALASLARLRAAGIDPAHGGEAARKRGAANARRIAEAKAFDQTSSAPPDPDGFRLEVLPRLQNVPVRKMADATGLSRGYSSMIRRGVCTPHQRHWNALRALV
jgi:hypothetical protein